MKSRAAHTPVITRETIAFVPVLTSEAGRIWRRSAETVRALERSGVLKAIRTAGGVRVFNLADVERLAREREARPQMPQAAEWPI